MTGAEVVAALDLGSAVRLDKRIRLMASTVRENIIKIGSLVEEAKAGDIHVALGFASWTAYLADALGGHLELDTDSRREVVALMSGEGMSQRAIAQAMGVSQKTIDRDLDKVSQVSHGDSPVVPDAVVAEYFDSTAEAADAMAMADVDNATFEAVLAEARAEGDLSRANVADKCRGQAERPTVTGLDGKTYSRPEPKPPSPPRRRPITIAFDEQVWKISKLVTSAERLSEDDRFASNRESLTFRRSDLVRARDALDRVIAKLDNPAAAR